MTPEDFNLDAELLNPGTGLKCQSGGWAIREFLDKLTAEHLEEGSMTKKEFDFNGREIMFVKITNSQSGNWIKPEKCDGPIVNLDALKTIELLPAEHETPWRIRFTPDRNDLFFAWRYESEADRDHDYQRVLKQLGLG